MRAIALLLLATACGGAADGGTPRIPLALSLDATTASSLGQLQFTFLLNPDRYDCATITSTCLKTVADPSDIVELTTPSGGSAKSFVVTLSSDPSNQTFDVTGIPVENQKLTLVVEGVTRDGSMLGASGCTSLPSISQGTNPAVAVALAPPATMQTCDPLF